MASNQTVIVSVDLGTTYTGVAWMTPTMPIQVINDWPGSGDRSERKAPTTIIYSADGEVSSWGFLCDEEEEHGDLRNKRRCDLFKIFMDPETLADARAQGVAGAPQSTGEAERMVTDYLKHVYAHIKQTVETKTGRTYSGGWKDMTVDFLFSVPTTWTSLAIINSFKGVIHAAGFGAEGPRHSAQVDLTEAEAAAITTLKNSAVQFPMGSVFLAVDAGGGTTDLALMQVTAAEQAVPQMTSIHAVNGVGIGATLVDRLFARLVTQRLAPFPEITSRLPADYAARLTRSHHFRSYKHKFGNKVYMTGAFRIPIEGMAHDYSHPGAGVENGKMVFSQQEIQSLFDPQVEGIIRRITEQLEWLRSNGLPQQVQYMVLSGGLGSSVYVRRRLEEQFMKFPHPNANQVAVIPCNEPQLVVVRGLLLDQQQRWETGGTRSVLQSRIARASYGVVVREAYVPTRHLDEDVQEDRFSKGQKFAINQIQWLIRKGDPVSPNTPLVKSFEIRLAEGEVTRKWASKIVVSQNEPGFLPTSMKKPGAAKLCDVHSNLTGVQQKQLVERSKRGSCFSSGYKFYVCQFDVRVLVGAADLQFELWFGGEKFSGNHEPISIDWDAEGTRVRA